MAELTFVSSSATWIAVCVWRVTGPVRILDVPFAKAMKIISCKKIHVISLQTSAYLLCRSETVERLCVWPDLARTHPRNHYVWCSLATFQQPQCQLCQHTRLGTNRGNMNKTIKFSINMIKKEWIIQLMVGEHIGTHCLLVQTKTESRNEQAFLCDVSPSSAKTTILNQFFRTGQPDNPYLFCQELTLQICSRWMILQLFCQETENIQTLVKTKPSNKFGGRLEIGCTHMIPLPFPQALSFSCRDWMLM